MSKGRKIFLITMVIAVVLMAGVPFSYRLISWAIVGTSASDDAHSVFIVITTTYLFGMLTFASFFMWAFLRGEFNNIEASKFDMIDMDKRYDRVEHTEV